jgi:hypothetical protein
MERDRSKKSLRADGSAAALRARGADCQRVLGVVELPGRSWTTRRLPRNRNLQLRRSLAQSRRRICFIPGDEGIVAPVCVADTRSGPEPGSAAQLLELWFIFRNSCAKRFLALVYCLDSSRQQSHSAAFNLLRQLANHN